MGRKSCVSDTSDDETLRQILGGSQPVMTPVGGDSSGPAWFPRVSGRSRSAPLPRGPAAWECAGPPSGRAQLRSVPWAQKRAPKPPAQQTSPSASSSWGAASGGAREGRSRHSRMVCVASGAWITATSRMRQPQRGHSSTSIAKTRRSRSAHATRRRRRDGSRCGPGSRIDGAPWCATACGCGSRLCSSACLPADVTPPIEAGLGHQPLRPRT